MIIKSLNVNDIQPSAFNPRVALEKNSKEYRDIADSIREFGFVEPLVVNEHNMSCIGGHQRLQVLKDTGVQEVDCVIINEPDQTKEKALCVALNKIKGDWDMDKLAELLGDEEVSVFPTGFAEGEVDLSAYLPDEEPELPIEEEPEEEPEEQGEVQESTTVIKIGGFSFTATASEYYGLLESIRDAGIFDSKGIGEEIKRRILND